MTDEPTTHDSEETSPSCAARSTTCRPALEAISSGGVDAVVVGTAGAGAGLHAGQRGPPVPRHRREMGEGAATVSDNGVVLFANEHFAELLGPGPRHLIGGSLTHYFGRASTATSWPTCSSTAGGGDAACRASPHGRRAEPDAGPGGRDRPRPGRRPGAMRAGVTDLTTKKRIDEQIALAAARDLQAAPQPASGARGQRRPRAGPGRCRDGPRPGAVQRARKPIARTSPRARRWIGELASTTRSSPE